MPTEGRGWHRLVLGAATFAVVIGVALALGAPEAAAHPVRVGRYAEIPYGIRGAHPYPIERGDSRRTGRLRGHAPHAEPSRAWDHALRHPRPSGPIIAADGTLYLGTRGGLTALGPDGTERWSVSIGQLVSAPSLAPSDDVIAVTRGGLVAVVSPAGVVRETADLGAPARGSPLVLDDGSVLIATLDRRVHRLDASLRRVFVTELADGLVNSVTRTRRGQLALTAGRVLSILSPEGYLTRTAALSGRATGAAAVADDGTLWVSTLDGAGAGVLDAIEPNGERRSRTELGSRHYDGAALVVGHDGAVRVPTVSEGVVCVGPSGTERWRAPNPQGYNAPASIDEEDTTLLVDRGGRLIAIAADGTERWRVVLGRHAYEAPVMGADGTIYIATENGVQAWR